jgi:UDP-glucose 4-epimerase
MRILITGGAGFIGSHTIDAALAAGHEVRVFDNLSTGSRDNVPANVELVVGDVTDRSQVRAAAEGCAAILHLAAIVSVQQSLREPVETYTINTTGTVNVLEAAREVGINRFVLASTCAVYGDLPGRKDENSPVSPNTPYAASKLMAEQWVQAYTSVYKLRTIILRYFNVFGPRQLASSPYSGVLPRWCEAIQQGKPCIVFGDGQQTRDFISVRDVAAANLLALTNDGLPPGAVYPVATGQSTSLNDLLATLDVITGRHVARDYAPARVGDILHSLGSGARLQAYGWRPQVSLQEGLHELLTNQLA